MISLPDEGLGVALHRGDLDVLNGVVAGEDALHLYRGDKRGGRKTLFSTVACFICNSQCRVCSMESVRPSYPASGNFFLRDGSVFTLRGTNVYLHLNFIV